MPRRSPLNERHASALHRHVGACSHRDTHIRLSERWRIVDAVARHGDALSLVLQILDDCGFLVGQHIGLDMIDAEGPGDRFRRRPVVARQHHHRMPSLCSASIASRALSLMGSATPISTCEHARRQRRT